MKVMTWNIWDIPSAKLRGARTAKIAALLTAWATDEAGPDIVLLQEVWSARRRPLFRACYPHVAEAERYWRNPTNWLAGPVEFLTRGHTTIDSGLMTMSKHPVLEVRRHVYRGGEGLARKSALAALIKTPDLGAVWCVNTHLCAPYTHTLNTPHRASQLAELGAFLKTLDGPPIVIGGDFNVAPPSVGPFPAWSYDPALWPDAMAAALPGFAAAPEGETHLTYTTTHNPWADPREGDNRLDYIFASPGLTARDGVVAMTERHALGPGRPKPLSDHFAVTTVIGRG